MSIFFCLHTDIKYITSHIQALSGLSVKCFPYLNINSEDVLLLKSTLLRLFNLCLACVLPSAHKPNNPHVSHLFSIIPASPPPVYLN